MSMCFDLVSTMSFWAICIAPWLSTYTSISLILKPSSPNKVLTHVTCLAVSDNAMYSDSVEDKATVFCFLEVQLTGAPANFIRYPVTDFRVSLHSAQSASVYANRPSWLLPS